MNYCSKPIARCKSKNLLATWYHTGKWLPKDGDEIIVMSNNWREKWTKTADRSDVVAKNDTSSAKRILVVEDNEEFRAIIKQTLEGAGYIYLEASDGEQALSLCQKSAKMDLIICDIILPGMNGSELVNEIRKMSSDVKVIFMSGHVNEGLISQDVDPVIESGSLFIQKPFLARKLLTAIDYLFGTC